MPGISFWKTRRDQQTETRLNFAVSKKRKFLETGEKKKELCYDRVAMLGKNRKSSPPQKQSSLHYAGKASRKGAAASSAVFAALASILALACLGLLVSTLLASLKLRSDAYRYLVIAPRKSAAYSDIEVLGNSKRFQLTPAEGALGRMFAA